MTGLAGREGREQGATQLAQGVSVWIRWKGGVVVGGLSSDHGKKCPNVSPHKTTVPHHHTALKRLDLVNSEKGTRNVLLCY